jgi:hypothetical protein
MSQYFTPFEINEAAGTDTAKYQTISTNNASVASTAIESRRILITTGTATTFINFGSTPTAAVTNYVVPANSQMIFNFKSGNKVAVFTATQSYTSILDLD